MKNLKEKLKKQGGFTLIEMLIVVAIIAILIAVSIPLVNGALEQSRLATDAANERAAKAEALIMYVGAGELSDGSTKFETGKYYYYDAAAGTLATAAPTLYGKSTSLDDIGANGDSKEYIIVAVDKDGIVWFSWDGSTTWYKNNGPASTYVSTGNEATSVKPEDTFSAATADP